MRLSFTVYGVIFSKCRCLHIDLCVRIDFGKWQDSTSVVIVPVTEHYSIHLCQVHAELLSVFYKQVRLTRIHKQFVMLCLDIKAQAVFKPAPRCAFRILRKVDNTHACLLPVT